MQEPYRIKERLNLLGKQFGRLTVIERTDDYVSPKGVHASRWLCKCSCEKNTIKAVTTGCLTSGNTKSCGCLCADTIKKFSTKHKQSKKRLYDVFYDMKGRCYSKKFKGYNSYGGRGIKVCNEWLNDFMAFHDWAYANGYKEEVLPNGRNKWTLDRINVNGDYCPENCRWITVQEQAFNRRENRLITYNGKTQTITEWSKELKIHRNTLYNRINSNYSIEKAFTTPVKEKKTEEQIVKEKIEIIKYIKKGMKNKEISEKLGLSSWFVKETRKKYKKEQNNDTN